MTAVLIALLFVNAAFNLVVWPRFYSRVAKDARARDEHGKATRFLIVHAVLIGCALLIGAASAVAAVVALVVGV